MSDAIIVPGRGISQDGKLPPDSLSRVRKAVDLFRDGHGDYIVLSGKWSYHFNIDPVRTESQAMKEYAISLGVPSEKIIEEADSMDTLGNVYFTKKKIVEPRRWKGIVVVVSEDHMPRVVYLFNKIYGSNYNLQFICSDRVLDNAQYDKELQHEKQSMSITKKWLDDIPAGDDELIWNLVKEYHPAYKDRSSHKS